MENRITDISLLDPNKLYTYADYLTWRLKERVVLIKGKLFKMPPAPSPLHQEILSSLHVIIGSQLFNNNRKCSLYQAPFDVRLPLSKDDKVMTVVQPDLCVVCDKEKLDDKGCVGAPDLIVEVLSPSTAKKDMSDKFNLYEACGVKEYWVVEPNDALVWIYTLKNGEYIPQKPYVKTDIIRSELLDGLEIDLADVFKGDDWE